MAQRGILLPLVALWIAGPALAALLLWIDLRRETKFFWLVPHPTWRTVVPLIGQLFVQRPLVAIAVVVVPVVTLALTVALFVAAVRNRV